MKEASHSHVGALVQDAALAQATCRHCIPKHAVSIMMF